MENNLFQIMKNCFLFAEENQKFTSQHISLYLYLVNTCNRLHWNKTFGVPTEFVLHNLSMGYKTYKRSLIDLETYGAIKIVKKSTNQFSSLVIELNTCFGLASVKRPKQDQSRIKERPKHDQHNNTINTNINTNNIYIYSSECFDFYKDFYFQKFKTLYVESPKEMSVLNSLLEKLEQYRVSVNDKRSLNDFFKEFIKMIWALESPYFSSNFTLSVLNNKFNDIVSQSRNTKTKSVYKRPIKYNPGSFC